MGWKKRDIIEQAYAELALASYDFDLSPEEMQNALRRLDTMMAGWDGQGVHLGYLLSLSPDDGDIEDDSGLPLQVVEAVYLNLAVRIAAGKGKALAASTQSTAKAAFELLTARTASDQMAQMRANTSTPSGAGNRYSRRIFVCNGAANLDDEEALDFLGP